MQYQSIIRFFEYGNIEYGDIAAFNFSKTKKLVNAEFALQETGIITIDGFGYTKQEILTELERPDFPERLVHHISIWKRPDLLALLEQGVYNSDNSSWTELYYSKGFVHFLSPYFAPVYNNVMRGLLGQADLLAASGWLEYIKFVEPEDEEDALKSIRIYLDETIRFFRNLNDHSYKLRDNELHLWYNTSWSLFINKLPEQLLPYVDEVIGAIINFTVRIQNIDRSICYKISQELMLVQNANYSLTQLIRSNHEAYRQKYNSNQTYTNPTIKEKKNRKLYSGVNILYIILIATFGIARLTMSNNSGKDRRNFDFSTNQEVGTYNPYPEDSTEDQVFTSKQVKGIIADTASEAQNQNVVSNDGNSIENIRSFFEAEYINSRKTGVQSLSRQQLAQTAFAKKPMYFFVEGRSADFSEQNIIAIENSTSAPINVDILWAGLVYHHSVTANSYIGFRASAGDNVDFVITFNKGNDNHFTANQYTTQYLHLRSGDTRLPETVAGKYFALEEQPYLLHSQLKTSQLYIQVKEDNNHVFLTMDGVYKVYNSLKDNAR